MMRKFKKGDRIRYVAPLPGSEIDVAVSIGDIFEVIDVDTFPGTRFEYYCTPIKSELDANIWLARGEIAPSLEHLFQEDV